jgi:protoporphyrinogen oxidase
MRRYPTVILGAGLCGLSAAYHLEEKGNTDYLILEHNPEVGGSARTATYDGFSFDHAIHVLYSRDPYATDLICSKLLKGNTLKQTRRSYCYTAGVHTEYPYQMNNHGLPPAIVVENIMGLVEARYESLRNGSPPHFESWIYQTFGRGIAEHFMIPYNRRQWAWDLQEMNYDWIADRVATPGIRDVLLGALQPQERRYGPNQEFWYPLEGGIEALAKAFLRYIPSTRIWLNAAVVAVDSNRCEVLLADGRHVRYGRLISTIPLPVMVNLLGGAVPPAIRQRTAGLKHNTVHTVNIGLDGTDLATKQSIHWIYFPEESTIFHRVSFPCNLSPWMVPRGCSSIQVEISESVYRPCDRATLIQQSLEHLVRVGILKEGEARPASDGGRVRVAEVVTLDPAYVIYDLRHRENTRSIRNYLRRLNISTKGRFGEWEYLNMDHAILSGKAAAEEEAAG